MLLFLKNFKNSNLSFSRMVLLVAFSLSHLQLEDKKTHIVKYFEKKIKFECRLCTILSKRW